MGVSILIHNLLSPSNAAAELANTNRAFYKRGLCLTVAARSLPDPPEDSIQIGCLKEVFRSIESALDSGSFANKDSKQAKKRFDEANTKLQKYLNDYLPGVHLKSYMTTDRGSLLSFDDVVKEDISAKNTLENFSRTIVEKVESIKRSPKRTIAVIFWGAIPVESSGESLKYNSRVAGFIKIEEAARIDTLLHRAMEYATLQELSGARILKKLRTLELGLYPQIYRTFPLVDTTFERRRKILPLPPWTTVAELGHESVLHVVPNRHVMDSPKAKFDSFYTKDMAKDYSNAWPFLDRDGKRVGNSLAVRNRTPSHSISLLPPAQTPTSQPYDQHQPYRPHFHHPGVSIFPSTSSSCSSMTSAPSRTPSDENNEKSSIQNQGQATSVSGPLTILGDSLPSTSRTPIPKPFMSELGGTSMSSLSGSTLSFFTAREEISINGFYPEHLQPHPRPPTFSSTTSESSVYSSIPEQTIPWPVVNESSPTDLSDTATETSYAWSRASSTVTDYYNGMPYYQSWLDSSGVTSSEGDSWDFEYSSVR